MARVKHTPASRKSGKKKAPRASTSTQPSLSSSQSPATRERSRRGRKKMRNRQGTVALREIRHLQRSCELLIPAAPFIRCVKQITNQFSSEVSRWTPEAVVALQEVCNFFHAH
ncbi:histone H3-like centromeric protein HTR12 isoform X1 [Glycine max]|nr:histone H3-like centromeric protein HTR12 isoform X1 [Glycine max]RZB59278.1 histone H3-like centromeric protein HTR12 isoform B [Glycine soja]|eukprot:XP_006598914.1 histone H3-like centromeric protein HTR12 isoform X1 [Glycine max]